MKIAIIGFSGSGKSTLAAQYASKLGIAVLYIDTIQFLPNWVFRDLDEKNRMMTEFLDAHADTGWVIDGNYTKLSYERRMEEADKIIWMNFNRFSCFYRAFKRSITYRGKIRKSRAEGCDEKFDWAFMKWILWEGRTKQAYERYRGLIARYPEKSTVIRNQRQLDAFKHREGLI